MRTVVLSVTMLLTSLTGCSGSDNPLLGDWTLPRPIVPVDPAGDALLSFKDDGTAVVGFSNTKEPPTPLTWKADPEAKPVDGYKAVIALAMNNQPPHPCSYTATGTVLTLGPGCFDPDAVSLIRKGTPANDPAYLLGHWATHIQKDAGEVWDGVLRMDAGGTASWHGKIGRADHPGKYIAMGPSAGTWKADTSTKPPEGYDGTLTVAVDMLSFACPYKLAGNTLQTAPGCGPTFTRSYDP